MWGNIKLLISSICSVVVFTLLLVSTSTMSMAIRERFRELAVLKALGFRRRELFAFILAESFGLAMRGAILGAGGAWLLANTVDMEKVTGGFFPFFEVTPKILGLAFCRGGGAGDHRQSRSRHRGGADERGRGPEDAGLSERAYFTSVSAYLRGAG